MEHEGQHVSSQKFDISINFRTAKNDMNTLNKIKELQRVYYNGDVHNDILEHKIFDENGAAYIFLETNMANRPLKLMVDTGASISLIAINAISDSTRILNFIVKLSGIVGGVSVNTKGMVQGVLSIDNCLLGTTLHVVDREHAGPADGYLGYDFLMPYMAIINMNKMCLQINLRNIIKLKNNMDREDPRENNLINALERSADVSTELLTRDKISDGKKTNKSTNNGSTNISLPAHQQEPDDMNDSCCTEYYRAVAFYERKFEQIESFKVHSAENIRMSEYTGNPMKCNGGSRATYIYEKLNLAHCSKLERDFIRQLCENYPYQFFVEGDIVGSVDITKHYIKLIPNSKIINVRQYRIPHKHREILNEIITEFERQGIIEKCTSPYNSPALVLPKKVDAGGKSGYRFVVDYSKLNEITETESFPIPVIDDILDGLSGSRYFTTLDLKGAYYHIVVDENSRDYTAFTAGNAKYRYIKMPMGLAAAPFTWTKTVNKIFGPLLTRGVFIYMDDLIVYGETKEIHDRRLMAVFALIKENNLTLKISKCIFYATSFEYLGHVVTIDGYKANPKKIEAIKNYPRPENVKKVQRFLGLCAYFRRYVRNFARVAKPLTSLLKKETPFIWCSIQQNAFDKLKAALAEEVMLEFPDFEQTFYVTTDASDTAIGAMLSQGELPNDRPLYFYSKTLSDTQKRYSAIQKELLAVVEAIKAFRVYLYGRFFILITDHKPLCYLFNMKDCGSRLFRQRMELLDYNFKILHRPGAQNHVADALSRIEPITIEQMLEIENKEKSCHVLTREQAKREIEQSKTNVYCTVEEKTGTILNKRGFDILFHVLPIENDDLKEKLMNKFGVTTFRDEWHNFQKINYAIVISNQFSSRQNQNKTLACIKGMLEIAEDKGAEFIAINIDYENVRHYQYFKTTIEEVFKDKNISISIFLNKIVELTERKDIERILDLYHKSILGGHVGRDKMSQTIKRFYKWNNMEQDIRDYVKKCAICERTKTTINTKVPMEISSLGEILFDHTFIDFVGPIPQSVNGHKYIFTAICDVTKFLVAVPTYDCTAVTAAECLIEHIFCRYNFPSRLISDNATSFISLIIKEITRIFAVKKVNTTPYHPQANIVERVHRTLNAYLRAFTEKNKDQWSELLKFATFAYNNTVHTTTGYTPHELAHGFQIQIPSGLTKQKVTYNYENYADNVRNNIAKSLELAKEHLYNKKLKNKQYYDLNKMDIDLKIDDWVLLKSQTKKHKFQDVYEGPYKVLDVFDSHIEILKGGKRYKIHKNLVKKSEAGQANGLPTPTQVVDLNCLDAELANRINHIYSIKL